VLVSQALIYLHLNNHTMPPFGNEDAKGVLLRSSRSSFFKDDVLDHCFQADGVRPEHLNLLLNRMKEDSVPADLLSSTRDLFVRSSDLEDKVLNNGEYSILKRAIHGSIRYTLTVILDQMATLIESEGDIKLVVLGLTKSAIERSFRFLDRIETILFDPGTDNLESHLRELLVDDGLRVEDPHIRVSVLSSSPSFEFMAGQTDTQRINETSSDSLPLTVNTTPFLFVKASDILERSRGWQQCKTCHVKVDFCSHKKLFSSHGSGVIGEAIVRAHVSPGNHFEACKKEGCVWHQESGDRGTLRVAEVRA
jgi:hypothetical protein